jgi:hypothetical protein
MLLIGFVVKKLPRVVVDFIDLDLKLIPYTSIIMPKTGIIMSNLEKVENVPNVDIFLSSHREQSGETPPPGNVLEI